MVLFYRVTYNPRCLVWRCGREWVKCDVSIKCFVFRDAFFTTREKKTISGKIKHILAECRARRLNDGSFEEVHFCRRHQTADGLTATWKREKRFVSFAESGADGKNRQQNSLDWPHTHGPVRAMVGLSGRRIWPPHPFSSGCSAGLCAPAPVA